jgi:hypothetical protein
MPGQVKELTTVAKINSARLDGLCNPEVASLARGLVDEFSAGQPSAEFFNLINRLDKHFGGFYISFS